MSKLTPKTLPSSPSLWQKFISFDFDLLAGDIYSFHMFSPTVMSGVFGLNSEWHGCGASAGVARCRIILVKPKPEPQRDAVDFSLFKISWLGKAGG
jgi:hypothetical protein